MAEFDGRAMLSAAIKTIGVAPLLTVF